MRAADRDFEKVLGRVVDKQSVVAAYEFADAAHGRVQQVRKYTGEPYIFHPVGVAMLVTRFEFDDSMVKAALLHDTKEDTGVSIATLEELFEKDTASLVDELSDVSTLADGNRETRKALDRAHSASASARGKTIKLLDLTLNTASIVKHSREFARIYLREKGLLLEVLEDASDRKALDLAWSAYKRACKALEAA